MSSTPDEDLRWASQLSNSALAAFIAVAEEGHFRRAAARLHIDQSVVTRYVQALEGRLGVTLFERSTRHVALTPEGVALMPSARLVVASLSRLRP